MKLITVTAQFEYVIVCPDDADENAQEQIARNEVSDAFRDLATFDVDFTVTQFERYRPSDWDDDCIPYGGDGNTRTGEYLKGKA